MDWDELWDRLIRRLHRATTVVVWCMLLGFCALVFYAPIRIVLASPLAITRLACWVVAVLLALWPATYIVKKLGLWGDW